MKKSVYSIKSQNELLSGYLFAKLSKVITSDEKLIKFYGLRDKGQWNNQESISKKQEIVKLLRELACQQQELLKYNTTKLPDLSFDAVKHKDILEDNVIVSIYLKSRILFNERELLSKTSAANLLDLNMSLRYIELVNSKVIAITHNANLCTTELLPTMEKKEFWEGKASIIADGISYFPTFTGTNILLASEMLRKGNIILSY